MRRADSPLGAPGKTKPKERIDDEISRGQRRRAARLMDREFQPFEDRQLVLSGSALRAVAEEDFDVGTPIRQMTGSDHAVSTVPSRSAQEQNTLTSRIALEHVASIEGDSTPSGLHDLEHIKSKLIDRDAIDLGHLRGGDCGQRWCGSVQDSLLLRLGIDLVDARLKEFEDKI